MATIEEIMAMADADRASAGSSVTSAAPDLTAEDLKQQMEATTLSSLGEVSPLSERFRGVSTEDILAQTAAPSANLALSTPEKRAANTLMGGLAGIADTLTFGGFSPASARLNALLVAPDNRIDYENAVLEQEATLAAQKQLFREAAQNVPGGSIAGIPISELSASLANPIDQLRILRATRAAAGPLKRAFLESGLGAASAATTAALNVETPPEEKDAAIENAATYGAILSGGGSILGSALSGAATGLTKLGKSVKRSSIGARQSDYQKVATRSGITPQEKTQLQEDLIQQDPQFTPDVAETVVKKNVDELLASGELGKSRVPSTMVRVAGQKLENLSRQVDETIASFDSANKKPLPPVSFANTMDWIEKGNAGAKADKFLQDVFDLESRLATSKNKLAFVQAEKRALAKQYSAGDDLDAAFGRKLYNDLKVYIEDKVPDVVGLNKQQQKWMTVMPILRRGLAKEEAFDAMGALQRLSFTTGGIAAPTIAGMGLGAAAGEPEQGALRGAMLGLALRGITSPSGKRIVGSGMTNLGSLGEALFPSTTATQLSQIGRTAASQPREQVSDQVTPTPQATPSASSPLTREQRAKLLGMKKRLGSAPARKQNVAALVADKPPIIKAMIQQESNFDPKAKSKKGAGGLMQLMPATAKSLGVDDVFDPEQNVQAGERYYNQLRSQFKDERLALAAYNWGPINVMKAQERLLAKDREATWANMLRYTSVPDETAKYVENVLQKKRQYEG